MDSEPQDVRSLRERLKALDCERQALMLRLRDLESRGASTPADKIGLFRKLFAGRTDVFPVRWENPRTGKAGYSPA